MKKLLLPILALALVGCGNSTTSTNSSWTKVDEPNAITICYGSQCRSYISEDLNSLYYSFNGGTIVTIKVKYETKYDKISKIDTYIGNNLNIVIWEN